MENSLPTHISNENDLLALESYFKEKLTIENPQKNTYSFLEKYIAAPIRIQSLIGGRIIANSGILREIGEDFILIEGFSKGRMLIIPKADIKFIYLTHRRGN